MLHIGSGAQGGGVPQVGDNNSHSHTDPTARARVDDVSYLASHELMLY